MLFPKPKILSFTQGFIVFYYKKGEGHYYYGPSDAGRCHHDAGILPGRSQDDAGALAGRWDINKIEYIVYIYMYIYIYI